MKDIKNNLVRAGAFFALLVLSFAFTANSQETSADDLSNIMKLWNGSYNNDKQVSEIRSDGRPLWQHAKEGEVQQMLGGHFEITSHNSWVDLSIFDGTALYVEETTKGNPKPTYRQKIYTFTYDDTKKETRLKIWNFKDREKYVGAWSDIDTISQLTLEELSPLPDACDMIAWRLEDGRYHFKMGNPECKFGTDLFDYQIIIGVNSYWSRDRIERVEDHVVTYTAGGFTYHKLDKIK